MLHPHAQLRFIDEEIGYGIFATRLIPRGTITWAQDPLDQVYPPEQLTRLPDGVRVLLEKYAYIDAAGNHILCWDFGRFMNHSCAPNTGTGGTTFDIATRAIHTGEELTYDYAALNITHSFPCRCGCAGCTGLVQPNPHWNRRPEWLATLRGSLPLLGEVPQPLQYLVEWNTVVQAFVSQGLPVPTAFAATKGVIATS